MTEYGVDISEQHKSSANELASDFVHLLQSGVLTDFYFRPSRSLYTGQEHMPDSEKDHRIPVGAHKCVLAARSTFFKTMFLSPMLEGQQGVQYIDIPETVEALQLMLSWFYSGDWCRFESLSDGVTHSNDNETDLLDSGNVTTYKAKLEEVFGCYSLAHRYFVIPLIEKCEKHIRGVQQPCQLATVIIWSCKNGFEEIYSATFDKLFATTTRKQTNKENDTVWKKLLGYKTTRRYVIERLIFNEIGINDNLIPVVETLKVALVHDASRMLTICHLFLPYLISVTDAQNKTHQNPVGTSFHKPGTSGDDENTCTVNMQTPSANAGDCSRLDNHVANALTRSHPSIGHRVSRRLSLSSIDFTRQEETSTRHITTANSIRGRNGADYVRPQLRIRRRLSAANTTIHTRPTDCNAIGRVSRQKTHKKTPNHSKQHIPVQVTIDILSQMWEAAKALDDEELERQVYTCTLKQWTQ